MEVIESIKVCSRFCTELLHGDFFSAYTWRL